MADREYAGAVHVHTAFSDGGTPAEAVLEVAAHVGLDFVIMSDHNAAGARRAGLVGWHGRTLCLCAPEIGERGHPHFFALGLADPEPLEGLSPKAALEAAQSRDARNFIAHPHAARLRAYSKKPVDWTDWTATAFCGIEIWSYIHDVFDQAIPWRLPLIALAPRRLVRGPRPETLAIWDRLGQTRRVAGVGALDNHAHMLLGLFEVYPHADVFRTLRTHVVCPELPAAGAAAETALIAALAAGSAFVAFDAWADSTGFRFAAEGPGAPLSFGQETRFAPGWILHVQSPRPADLTILRDGRPVLSLRNTSTAALAVDQPGVYRLEARLDGRPWIFANPIYFRP
jgi:hypothetical protein